MDSVEGASLSMEKLSILCDCLSEEFVFKEILSKLPVKSLIRFKCVSKDWLARISSDPSLIAVEPSDLIRAAYQSEDDDNNRLFLIGHGESNPVEVDMSHVTKSQERSEEEIDYFYLLGSSNGLVFIQQFYKDEQFLLVVWNPATREFKNLPEPIVPALTPGMSSHCGFDDHSIGFGKDSKDYKIVRVGELHTVYETHVKLTLHVQLFTKSSGCWRELGVLSDFELQGNVEGGAVIGGFIYWALFRGKTTAKGGSLFWILRFDLCTEELKEIDGPASSQSNDRDYEHLELVKWKGSLGAIMTTALRNCEFWLNTNNGNRNGDLCWTKMLVIKRPVSLWPFRGVFRDQFLLFDYQNGKDILYDPVTMKRRRFQNEFGKIIAYNCLHYVPSLISPN